LSKRGNKGRALPKRGNKEEGRVLESLNQDLGRRWVIKI